MSKRRTPSSTSRTAAVEFRECLRELMQVLMVADIAAKQRGDLYAQMEYQMYHQKARRLLNKYGCIVVTPGYFVPDGAE